ncbi:ImmA/IrrE family metallo-endopeptidase [Marinimicrococcus flavescens]|uniref:ImmA/IrrE family metallo-endopeptidase n=1 Tax=Marinimicrococcus flavescens TaxID=3031815 RepID=A0AAP3XQS2_9PROT|nr:ImmA/IrrE family metallo-endopeptidase [Marinimicrococcus flavescens]
MTTALELIRKYQESSPVDVEGLIRSFGLELVKSRDLDGAILGQITPNDNGSFTITVNKADHYFRQRFTMAHELGHYLMHRHLIGTGVDDNVAYRSTDAGSYYNLRIKQTHEVQANQFAAHLLMPTQLVKEEWERLKPDFKAMAREFQVSPAAMRIRIEGMGL